MSVNLIFSSATKCSKQTNKQKNGIMYIFQLHYCIYMFILWRLHLLTIKAAKVRSLNDEFFLDYVLLNNRIKHERSSILTVGVFAEWQTASFNCTLYSLIRKVYRRLTLAKLSVLVCTMYMLFFTLIFVLLFCVHYFCLFDKLLCYCHGHSCISIQQVDPMHEI